MHRNRLTEVRALVALCALGGWLAGCGSTSEKTPAASASGATTGTLATHYKADDGRTIDIGRSSSANGGLSFKNPHLDKCWIADGFKFSGYDTLYIAPSLSTAKLHDKEEEQPLELARQNLQFELQRLLTQREFGPRS